MQILTRIWKTGLFEGKRPNSVVSLAVYIAGLHLPEYIIDPEDICIVFSTCKSTLQKNFRLI